MSEKPIDRPLSTYCAIWYCKKAKTDWNSFTPVGPSVIPFSWPGQYHRLATSSPATTLPAGGFFDSVSTMLILLALAAPVKSGRSEGIRSKYWTLHQPQANLRAGVKSKSEIFRYLRMATTLVDLPNHQSSLPPNDGSMRTPWACLWHAY